MGSPSQEKRRSKSPRNERQRNTNTNKNSRHKRSSDDKSEKESRSSRSRDGRDDRSKQYDRDRQGSSYSSDKYSKRRNSGSKGNYHSDLLQSFQGLKPDINYGPDHQGPVSQGNIQGQGLQPNNQGQGPKANNQGSGSQGFQGSGPQGNFQGFAGPLQRNFQGPSSQGSFQGPCTKGNFQGLGSQGNFQGPGSHANFQGPGPQGSFQQQFPQGRPNFQGSGPQGSFQDGPGLKGNFQGPTSQSNFQGSGLQSNFQVPCLQNNFQGQGSQSNVQGTVPQGNYQGTGTQGIPQSNFQGAGPQSNFQGACPQRNFQGTFPGPTNQGNYRPNGPGFQGNFHGPAAIGNFQGPAATGNFQGTSPQRNFQGPGPQGNLQGPGPQGNFQGPGPQGNFQGPGPQGNFQGSIGQGNFQRPSIKGNFQGQDSQGSYQGPCLQNSYPQSGSLQQYGHPQNNYQGPQGGHQYQNVIRDATMQGNAVNNAPLMYQQNNQSNMIVPPSLPQVDYKSTCFPSYYAPSSIVSSSGNASQTTVADTSIPVETKKKNNVSDIPEPVLPPLPQFFPSSKKEASSALSTIDIALPPLPPKPPKFKEKNKKDSKLNFDASLQSIIEKEHECGVQGTKDEVMDLNIVDSADTSTSAVHSLIDGKQQNKIKETVKIDAEDIKDLNKNIGSEIRETSKSGKILVTEKGKLEKVRPNNNEKTADKDEEHNDQSATFESQKDKSNAVKDEKAERRPPPVGTLDLLAMAMQRQQTNSTVSNSCITNASLTAKLQIASLSSSTPVTTKKMNLTLSANNTKTDSTPTSESHDKEPPSTPISTMKLNQPLDVITKINPIPASVPHDKEPPSSHISTMKLNQPLYATIKPNPISASVSHDYEPISTPISTMKLNQPLDDTTKTQQKSASVPQDNDPHSILVSTNKPNLPLSAGLITERDPTLCLETQDKETYAPISSVKWNLPLLESFTSTAPIVGSGQQSNEASSTPTSTKELSLPLSVTAKKEPTLVSEPKDKGTLFTPALTEKLILPLSVSKGESVLISESPSKETSTTHFSTKKLNLPCLGKEAAKKRLKSFSSSSILKKEMRSIKTLPVFQQPQQLNECFEDNNSKTTPLQVETLEDERKDKKKEKKRKEKVSVIEQIMEEETRIKEVLSYTIPNNPYSLGQRMAEISNLFDNPEALKKFEARGKDIKEKMEKGQFSTDSPIKRSRERSRTPSKMESSRQRSSSFKRTDGNESKKESKPSLKNDSAEDEMKRDSSKKVIDEKKSESKSSSKKYEEKKRKSTCFKDSSENASKSDRHLKQTPKSWKDLADMNITLDELQAIVKCKHSRSHSPTRSYSRSPSRSRRESGSRDSRRSRSHSRDRSFRRNRDNISPFPELPKQFEMFKVNNAFNYDTKEYKGSFVQHTLAEPSIPYSVAPKKHQNHYWNRMELRIKNKFHPEVIDIVEEFWKGKTHSTFKERPKLKHPWFADDFMSSKISPDEDNKGKKMTALDYLSSSYKADTALEMFEKEMEEADKLIEKLKSRETKESIAPSYDEAAELHPRKSSKKKKKKKKNKTDSKSPVLAPSVDTSVEESSFIEPDDDGKLSKQELNEEYEAFINTLEIKPEEAGNLSDDNLDFNASLLSFDDCQQPAKEESGTKPQSNNPKKKQEEEVKSTKQLKKLLLNPNLSKKRRKKLKRLKKNLKREKQEKKKQKREMKKHRKAEKKLKKKEERLLAQEEIILLDNESLQAPKQMQSFVQKTETESGGKNLTDELEDYQVVEWEEYDDEGSVESVPLVSESVPVSVDQSSSDHVYQEYQASENEEAYEPASMSYSDSSSGFYDMSQSSLSSYAKSDEACSYPDTTNQVSEVPEMYSPSNMSVCSTGSVDNLQEYSPSQVKISSPYSPPSPEPSSGDLKHAVRSPSPYSPSSPQSSSDSESGETLMSGSRRPILDTIPMPSQALGILPASSLQKLEEKSGVEQSSSALDGSGTISVPTSSINSASENNLAPLQKAFQPVIFRLGSTKQSAGFRLLQKAPLPGFSEEGEEEEVRTLASLGKKNQKLSMALPEKTEAKDEQSSGVDSSKENEQSDRKTEDKINDEQSHRKTEDKKDKKKEEEVKKSSHKSRSESTSSKKDKKRDRRERSSHKERSQSPQSKWKRIKSPPPKKYRDKTHEWDHKKEKHRDRKHSRSRSKSQSEQDEKSEYDVKQSRDHHSPEHDVKQSGNHSPDSAPRPIDSISNLFNQGSNQNESWDWAGPDSGIAIGDHKEFYDHIGGDGLHSCLSTGTQKRKSVSPDASPKRLSLDERLKQEHGVEIEEEAVALQEMYPPTQEGYYWEYNHPSTQSHVQVSAVQPGSGKPQVIRVGNVLQVLPQDSPEKPGIAIQDSQYNPGIEQTPKIVQAGNVIQVVPTNNFQDATSESAVSEVKEKETHVEVAPVPPPTSDPLALISSILAASMTQPITCTASQEAVHTATTESTPGEEFSQAARGEEKIAAHTTLDSQQQQAILTAVAAAAASGVTASNLPIAHLISVLQQQNLLTQPSAVPAAPEQAPESVAPVVSPPPKRVPPQFDLETFKRQRQERKERKRKERDEKRRSKRQKALIKKLEMEANIQPVLNEVLDEDDAIYKEAISEVPELGSPIPDYEIYNEDELGDEDGDEKKPPFVPLPDAPEKGILIGPRNSYKILRNKDNKSVSFADGVMPGYGSSPSGGEEIHSPPPPKPKQEKKEKKQKNRKKKKVKVRMIKQYLMGENRMDSPPPPPDSPPTPNVLRLYPGCTHYTCIAPGTFVIYTQQAVETNGKAELQLATGSTVTIPPGMLIHSSALSKNFVPNATGEKMDTSIPPSMPNTYPGYAFPQYYAVSAPSDVSIGITTQLLQSPLA